MSATTTPGNDEYNRISKALAAFLSPWALLVLSICVLGITYFVYYKPRLFYGYKSFPSGTSIYLIPPIWRKRKFKEDPIKFLKSARESPLTIFWTDVVKLSGSKTLSIICDNRMASQFLEIDDQDSLSWDAPLRAAWANIIDHGSNFGVSRQFYAASRYSLVNVFTEASTKDTSLYAQVVQGIASTCIARDESLDLYQLLDRITSSSLLSIFFGQDSAREELTNPFDRVASSLTIGKRHSKRSIKDSSISLRHALTQIIKDRLVDAEANSGHSDYLQWLIHNQHVFSKYSDSTASTSTTRPSTGTTQPADLPRSTWILDIADHLLVTMLQTRLLVTIYTFWTFTTKVVRDIDLCCAPLFLIRQTREETLFGSKIVPKNCLVAISPPLQRTTGQRLLNGNAQTWNMQHDYSLSDLDEYSTTCSTADSPRSIYKSPMSRTLGSMDGKSPLLASTRYSSSISMNNLTEDVKHSTGDWDRLYPQSHLIQLMKKTILQVAEDKIVLADNTVITHKYGPARSLWLPIPLDSISISLSKDQSSPYRSVLTNLSHV